MACVYRGADAAAIARLLSQLSVRRSTSATSVNRAASRSLVARRQRGCLSCQLLLCSASVHVVIYVDARTWQACKSCRCLYSSCLCALWFIFNLSFHLPQLPPLPLLYLFLTESSGGVDFVSFQVLSVSRFSCKVASRQQLAEPGPRWPPSLRPPPIPTALRPRKPLARR